ncbi:MAG TPA: alanine dehydrogenase [Bacteroidota bacterium]|nr:alanine dehydrogenase [Bacteroidota bacterium]
MKYGILKEDLINEKRVALSPAGVRSLVGAGHTVYVEKGAGQLAQFTDEEYQHAGATIGFHREEIVNRSDIILKISSPLPHDLTELDEGQVLFAFMHLGASKRKTIEELLARKITALAYELIENSRGELPVLQIMSEIAGQLSMQIAGHFLQARDGGRGILLGSVPGTAPASVVILGAGTVGRTAARVALGMGASVTVLDKDLGRLREIENLFQWRVSTGMATEYAIIRAVKHADVLIGAVLVKGERAPYVVTEPMVQQMKAGSVIVDASIDQGGCVETSRPTTLADPVFVRHGVVHYCVPNIPSAVPRTATTALTNAILPYLLAVGEQGIQRALQSDGGFARGVVTYHGACVQPAIAKALGFEYSELSKAIWSPTSTIEIPQIPG